MLQSLSDEICERRYPAKVRSRIRVFVTTVLLCALSAFAATTDEAVRSITAALRANRFQSAFEQARAARQTAPNEVRLVLLEGMALTGLHRDDEALKVLQTAVEIAPEYVPALEALAEIEYRQGRPEADNHLQRLLKLRPGETTAHAMLGALAWKQSNCAAAVEHYSQAKALIATRADALREFGACLVKLRRPDEAADVFRRLLALQRDDRRATYSLAVAQLDGGRFRETVALLQPLASSTPPDPVALELTATAHEALGETPEAVAALRKAVLADPKNVNLYLDVASLSFTHQSFQVGIDMLNAGLTQAPASGALYLARGVLYVQLADFAKADADFDRAERLDPSRSLGSAARGLSQIQQNNLDDALATIHAQLKVNPNDHFLHYVLAELLSRRGAEPGTPEFQQAIAAAREALRLKPDFVPARDVLSRFYLQSGESEKAIEQCRLALRDNPSDEMALYRLIRATQAGGSQEAKAEIPALLKRLNAVREEAREREAQVTKYRLVDETPNRRR
jgi:tetratricopeptide (TPR) repeat protein